MQYEPAAGVIETDIPARLDRLPWARFHTLVVLALGVTWSLDGLEVTLAGAVSGALKRSAVLQFNNAEVGLAASIYLAGLVGGGLLFGWLTDRIGRRPLFFITLGVYVIGTAATGLAWNFWSYALFRCITGCGIGGECTAINSAIQELIPARVRGGTDIAINGSFWLGAVLGASGSIILLDPAFLPGDYGWRFCFLIGAALGLIILPMRLWLPESPRWLMTHGRPAEAADVADSIERRAGVQGPVFGLPVMRFRARAHGSFGEVLDVLFRRHRQRALVAVVLMASQAFFYNAIFFTYALILTDFYQVPADSVGKYLIPFALGNFTGPLLLGRLYDSIGRRTMIAVTYAISGVLLALTGAAFAAGMLTAATQTLCWSVVFFFASAAASSAYLTISEAFPLEVRAMAISIFLAFGTGVGGVVAPALLGWLIDTGSRGEVFIGYFAAAVLMVGAAIVQAIWGVSAERRALEEVARPLTALD
jgi:MFS family permease